MKYAIAPISLCALTISLSSAPVAQERSESATQNDNIEVITVKGQVFRGVESSYSATDITTDEIRYKRVSEINTLLEDVPGMSVIDYGLGGVASSTVIRGFGNGAHGGDLGVVVDGVPLNEANSHADGYVDLNVIVPLEIKRMTVFRGPVSALYGNFNRGGLLSLETRNAGNYTEADISAGSFDTFDSQLAVGREVSDNQSYNFAAQHYRTDGFRPQSDAKRNTVSGRGTFQVSPRLDLSLSGRYHETEAKSAGYTTLSQFETDPYGIDPRIKNDGADKEFATIRADAGYSFNSNTKLLTYAYTTQQDFTRWFTRGSATAESWRQREETYERTVYGVGTSLNGSVSIASRKIAYVAGVEHFSEETEFQYFEDLDFRRRVSPAEFDRESTLTSNAIFAEADIPLTQIINISLGVRADEFEGDCVPLGSETGGQPCEDLDSVSNVSPKIGLRAQVIESLKLRASYSEGFALASGFAKFAAGAQNLGVNKLQQYEIGAAFTPVSQISFDVSLYDIRSSNEINQVTPGVFQNFGETTRTGLESSLKWDVTNAVQLNAVYSYADSEVDQNINASLVGNQVTFVPDHTATITAHWFPVQKLRLSASVRYVGEYYIDAGNTSKADSYSILNLQAAYELDTQIPARVFVRLDNATDKAYAATVNSLGASPGAPRAVYAGIQFGF